jgi:hypothetical protein
MLGASARTLRVVALGCAFVVAVTTVAACGDDGGDDDEATGSTAPSTTEAPTTTVDEATQKEEAAEAAFLAYYDAYQKATAAPVDPEHPEMQALVTDLHKVVVTRNLQDRIARGEAVRLPTNSQNSHDIRSAELQPDGTVEIVDCQVDDSIIYDVESGRVVDDDVVTKLVTGSMAQESGAWKVAYTEVSQSWSGAGSCAD